MTRQVPRDDQARRGDLFRDLHTGPEPFVIANAWDAGSARILTRLGFPALATTSGGLAFSLGRPDGANLISLEEILANAQAIVAATSLPVSADLESGYGHSADEVAATVRLAAEAGLVGGSIEDATGHRDDPIHSFDSAVRRVSAAADAARSLAFPFTLTARAENFVYGRPDLKDTIRRLQAYEAAGADVLYAPGLPGADAVRAVCSCVGRPVNALAGGTGSGPSVAELASYGVRRISVGSAFSRAALGALTRAAEEVRDHGTFKFLTSAPSHGELNSLMARPADDLSWS
jgi:2-methylisocitrate lyase-like PEP mutase family enzyme